MVRQAETDRVRLGQSSSTYLADSSNNDGQPADIVLGQVDFEHEGPAQGCGVYERGMHLPSGAVVADGRLIVADAWHHRLLVWNQLPSNHNQPADYAIGQSDLVSIQPNRGSAPSATSLYWPYGVAWIDGRLYVADTGNRRVLAWHGIPTSSQRLTWSLVSQMRFRRKRTVVDRPAPARFVGRTLLRAIGINFGLPMRAIIVCSGGTISPPATWRLAGF